jgi:hypothetical protein
VRDTKNFRHDAILLATAGEYCFVADLDDNGNEIPDRWVLPGRTLLMKQTDVKTGETVGTFGKGKVVNTEYLERFAKSIGKALQVGDYSVLRITSKQLEADLKDFAEGNL